MRGLTWSPRAYRFGRVPPYLMYWLRQQAQTFIQDILGGISIPVVGSAAGEAYSFPHSEVFRPRPLCAAGGAELAGWIEAVYRDHLLPVPLSLILQLPPELAPRRI